LPHSNRHLAKGIAAFGSNQVQFQTTAKCTDNKEAEGEDSFSENDCVNYFAFRVVPHRRKLSLLLFRFQTLCRFGKFDKRYSRSFYRELGGESAGLRCFEERHEKRT